MLPLATTTWDKEEIQAIHDVIESDMYSMGPKVAEFEQAFADFTGSKYCVMVNSGSSANLLAVAALFFTKESYLQAGDEVIVPAVSWSTTYFPLQQYGLKLKFVDIDPQTLNLSLDQLEEAISPETKAIFAVNLLGNPIDYQKLNKLIAEKDILLIEDNCESLGACLNNKQAGTFGKLGTYSSFFSHHISTMEGGMVVTDDEELYHILLSIRSHGWTRHLPEQNLVCEKSSDAFYESFRFVLPGYNVRPIEMSGAIGLAQLKKLPEIIKGRRENAAYFVDQVSNIKGIQVQQETGESSWFGFALMFENTETRNKAVKQLSEQKVDCRPIVAGNFVNNPAIKFFDYEIHNNLKQADRIEQCGLFIGNHHYDVKEQIDHVIKLLQNIVSA